MKAASTAQEAGATKIDAHAGSTAGHRGRRSGEANTNTAECKSVAIDSRTFVIELQRKKERETRLNQQLHITSAECAERLKALMCEIPGTTGESQRARILHALAGGPVTTLELRDLCGVMACGARIWELIHRHDHQIAKVLVVQACYSGVRHFGVARYFLSDDMP